MSIGPETSGRLTVQSGTRDVTEIITIVTNP